MGEEEGGGTLMAVPAHGKHGRGWARDYRFGRRIGAVGLASAGVFALDALESSPTNTLSSRWRIRSFLFLGAVLLLFYASPRAVRKYILLAASYYFYANCNAKFLALLLTLTAIDYVAGLCLERVAPGCGARRC